MKYIVVIKEKNRQIPEVVECRKVYTDGKHFIFEGTKKQIICKYKVGTIIDISPIQNYFPLTYAEDQRIKQADC